MGGSGGVGGDALSSLVGRVVAVSATHARPGVLVPPNIAVVLVAAAYVPAAAVVPSGRSRGSPRANP